jgi:thiazole tautomerase (transcriptional regulator TenI)
LKHIPRLHLISNREICPLERFPDVALSAARGGVDAIHLREHGLSQSEFSKLAADTREKLASTGTLLFANSRDTDVSRLDVDGVHVPEQLQREIAQLRVKLPSDILIGTSVHKLDSARNAERLGADYIIAGHVFETGSKPGSEGRGLSFVEQMSRYVNLPVIAIGGITPERVEPVLKAGAHGVAVMSAILNAADPESMATQFRKAIEDSGT